MNSSNWVNRKTVLGLNQLFSNTYEEIFDESLESDQEQGVSEIVFNTYTDVIAKTIFHFDYYLVFLTINLINYESYEAVCL